MGCVGATHPIARQCVDAAMTRPLIILASLASLSGACAREQAPPQPDPVNVERLIAHLETNALAVAGPAADEPSLPLKAEETVSKADRLMVSLEKMPSERIAPSVAEALIAR
jgi:hypothetical protein